MFRKFALGATALAVLAACGEQYGNVPSKDALTRSGETRTVVSSPNVAALTAAAEANRRHYQTFHAPDAQETYTPIDPNPVLRVNDEPVSTFSIDVDTAAYANVRRFLRAGDAPPPDAVRIEELINYFSYAYPVPESTEQPFTVTTEMAPAPWNPDTLLLHVGLKGYEVVRAERPAANLVFLVDVSGSMDSPEKLPLVKRSLKMLTDELGPDDSIALVVYAGAAGVVLEPTPGSEKRKIGAALRRLEAGGSTAGGAGIELAYALAEESFDPDKINRVILATDGDFNVGVADPRQLKTLIEKKRETGIALSALGYVTGNYDDATMETLTNAGNGNAAYIDSMLEARKVLVDELNSTLLTIAKDVKVQIEFNPAVVAEYRLIGYENRVLREQDFTDDRIDAGDIGAGHSVTALYEITLVGGERRRLADLRYAPEAPVATGNTDELGFLKLRFKRPDADTSEPIERPLLVAEIGDDLAATSDDFRFAAAVAGFGQLLRGGALMGDYSQDDVVALANSARGDDPWGYRADFVQLARVAETLSN